MNKVVKETEYGAEKYTEKELARGVFFLLKEYYIGDFKTEGETVTASFENGQKFLFTVTEI